MNIWPPVVRVAFNLENGTLRIQGSQAIELYCRSARGKEELISTNDCGGFRGDSVRRFRYLVYLNNPASGKGVVKTVGLM